MKELKVRLNFFEGILGTASGNEDIYRDFIASKLENNPNTEEEVAAISMAQMVEKGKTIFPRNEDGNPIFYDYQIKGFFKDTCGGLKKVPGTKSSNIKAFKKEIDKLIFPKPRQIVINFNGKITECQRPLRASTAQGERIGLAISEEIPAGANCEFTVLCLSDAHVEAVKEWLSYGELSGIGQWRNSGKGRFTWTLLDEHTV